MSSLHATIVIEWENVRLSEMARCQEMLRRLRAQARQLADGSPSALLARPVETLVLYDCEEFQEAEVSAILNELIPADEDCLAVRLLAAPGREYYSMKNLGAAEAKGEIVVFLDSDVIPEEGWLAGLLAPFADPQVQVVGGNCFIAPENLYAKAFALSWFFPLRAEPGPLREEKYFYANNVAFRRSTLLMLPFPSLDGCARGACALLAQTLRDHGVTVWRNPAAQVSHPAPNGLSHFIHRALADGRDQLLFALRAGNPRQASLWRSVSRHARKGVKAVARVATKRRAVGLSLWQAPAALGISSVYYGLSLLGDLATRISPRYMERRFQL